jgi:murein L,D-transpeptidase YafK
MSTVKRSIGIFSLFILLFTSFSEVHASSFKQKQLKYAKVSKAYETHYENIEKLLEKHSIDIKKLRIYLRYFKFERSLEVWGKNDGDETYKLLLEYYACGSSGETGPKRQQGDYQIPEGFYFINKFNPYSSYHLSIQVNYPNQSDRIYGVKGNLGGLIFIHGYCVTIGCVPIDNDNIEELYVLSVEARNSGQREIPVHMFPTQMTHKNYKILQAKCKEEDNSCELWRSLMYVYRIFEETKMRPRVRFTRDGKHSVVK